MLDEEIRSLIQSESFPHAIEGVRCIETHISWILLTGEYAYKIKKPVNLGFLDYSSLNQRKQYCEEEVRLNSRTAPELYLGVAPIFCSNIGVNFLGEGKIIDYAVKMRQFDASALLSNPEKYGSLKIEFFQRLGQQLADFHCYISILTEELILYGAYSVWQPVHENFLQIAPKLADQVLWSKLKALETWSYNQFNILKPILEQRKANGFVRECHGDLHMGNIAVVKNDPVFFDGIEFSDSLRWIDTASDFAFLIMDLEFHSLSMQAMNVLNQYLDYSADYEALQVLKFFMVYRAMVRAKVAFLRTLQISNTKQKQIPEHNQAEFINEFEQYLSFALHITKQKARFLMVTVGVSGSGKTVLSTKLSQENSAIHLRSDVIRKQLAGMAPLQRSGSQGIGEGIYSEEHSQQTHVSLLAVAQQVLISGFSVIVDATFLKQNDRRPFLLLAKALNVAFIICHLESDEKTLQARLKKRMEKGQDASEANVAVMRSQLKSQEAFSDEELVFVKSGEDISSILQAIPA